MSNPALIFNSVVSLVTAALYWIAWVPFALGIYYSLKNRWHWAVVVFFLSCTASLIPWVHWWLAVCRVLNRDTDVLFSRTVGAAGHIVQVIGLFFLVYGLYRSTQRTSGHQTNMSESTGG